MNRQNRGNIQESLNGQSQLNEILYDSLMNEQRKKAQAHKQEVIEHLINPVIEDIMMTFDLPELSDEALNYIQLNMIAAMTNDLHKVS